MLFSPFFLVGCCFLLTHEMDAVRCEEWRIMPIMSALRGRSGYRVFTLLHIPLYALLLWALSGATTMNRGIVIGLDTFFVIHLLLHLLLRNLPGNRFGSAFSWSLFSGAGLCGALDLLLIR